MKNTLPTQKIIEIPVSRIPRVGPRYADKLGKLGIKKVIDLFYHFPHRYEDFSNIEKIENLAEGIPCTIIGQIKMAKNIFTFRRHMVITEITIEDDTGSAKAIWFNQPYLIDSLKKGLIVALAGKPTFKKHWSFSNPVHEIVRQEIQNKKPDLTHAGRLTPIYPETAGISSRWLRYIIRPLLQNIQLEDYLPKNVKAANGLIDLSEAIKQIHFPQNPVKANEAKKRLAFDEIFLIQIMLILQKAKWRKQKSVAIKFNQPLVKDFVNNLPFALTNAQRRAAWEILQDMEKTIPMNRLLEGDVGSGKTAVAAIAAIQAVKDSWQVALMAPTEILANQHFKTISHALKKYDLNVVLLTAGNPKSKKEKDAIINGIKKGACQIIIGTHALIQKDVKFKNLALAIVDEQHRFGVMQRAALLKQTGELSDGLPKTIPHLLSMTATPIPRTMALTLYGDLDLSILDEMPPGRQTIITKIVISKEKREETYEFIRQEIKKGRQVFVVCPRIEIVNSKTGAKSLTDYLKADVKAVKGEYEKLTKEIFPGFRIAMLHGKMKPSEKEKIMRDFNGGKTNILVSTSIIEVGIDMPNATIMMIEGAERFGLAQLHQLRGRVGRGKHQSYCFVLTALPSENKRLKALTRAKNGFELAEYDLELRGPGQFYGTAQWGMPDLAMASLADAELIKQTRRSVIDFIKTDPRLKNHPLLAEKLREFRKDIHNE